MEPKYTIENGCPFCKSMSYKPLVTNNNLSDIYCLKCGAVFKSPLHFEEDKGIFRGYYHSLPTEDYVKSGSFVNENNNEVNNET